MVPREARERERESEEEEILALLGSALSLGPSALRRRINYGYAKLRLSFNFVFYPHRNRVEPISFIPSFSVLLIFLSTLIYPSLSFTAISDYRMSVSCQREERSDYLFPALAECAMPPPRQRSVLCQVTMDFEK